MIRTLQTNFTGGVMSGNVRDRIDLPSWRNGAARIENLNIHPQGGVSRRPGSTYIADAPASPDVQLEPFIFSADQQYVFLFRDLAADIYSKATRALVQTISTPWAGSIVAANELELVQSFDTMIGFHQTVQPHIIQRTASGLFSIGPLAYSVYFDGVQTGQRPPFHRYVAGNVKMWATPPANATSIFCDIGFFTAAYVGTYILLRGSIFAITGIVSTNEASCIALGPLPDSIPSVDWQEQAYSATRGWPRCGALHEQRLWMSGGASIPATVFGSTTYDPFNFWLGTGTGTDAIKYTASSDRVAEIRRMVSYNHLQIFAADGEFYAPTPDSGALTPANMSIRQASSYGIMRSPPARFDQSTVFLTRAGGAMREFVYEINQTNYSSDSISFLAGDIVRNPQDLNVSMEAQYAQQAQAFLTNADGTLAVLTKVRKENVGAWGLWKVGAYADTASGYSAIAAACVVQRELWAVVSTLDAAGTAAWRIVVFDTNYRLDLAVGKTSGSPQTAWPAMAPHLANRTVQAFANDLYLGEFTLNGAGDITIPTGVTNLQVGLPFVPLVQPLVQEVQLADGISWGQPRRVCSTTASFLDTISAQVGRDMLPFSNATEDPGVAPERFTGIFKSWHLGWDNDGVVISQLYPLPFTLRSVSMEVEI